MTEQPTIACACCGATITTGVCCTARPGAPWGTKCAEHEEQDPQ